MKTKCIISAAVACLLLTGCVANEKSYSPKVNYSDLFVPKTASNRSPQINEINGKAAAPVSDNYNTDADEESTQNKSAASNEDRAVSVSRSANAAAGRVEASDSVTTYADNDNEANAGSTASNEGTSSAETTPNAGADTPSKKINNPRPASVIYTDAQTVANLQFGDICYFAYKTIEADITENEIGSETTDTSENEDGQEDSDTQEKRYVPPKKYNYGYRVVFRTETDTYLLGIFPYDQCTLENVNDMCRKIDDLIEADCQMVGIPSLEDLQYFTECGIYLPGQYEMWTSTPANPNGSKFYYRNKKGAFYSTKSKTDKCGVCAIIKISASQSDPELLSSSLSNYEEAKARLEAEEEQYKLAISGKQEGEQEQE